MASSNSILLKSARESLKGKWRTAVFTCVIYWMMLAAGRMVPSLNTIASFIISMLVSGPLSLGLGWGTMAVRV